MKLESFLWRCRSHCCVSCRNTSSSVSAELDPSKQMFEWLLPRTATCRMPSLPELFVATCFTGSMFFRSRLLLCENDGKMFACWLSTLFIAAQGMQERT